MLKDDPGDRRWHACPRCGRRVEQDGEMILSADGGEVSLPVFCCQTCRTVDTTFGESLELPFTFVVDARGRAFDPAAADDA